MARGNPSGHNLFSYLHSSATYTLINTCTLLSTYSHFLPSPAGLSVAGGSCRARRALLHVEGASARGGRCCRAFYLVMCLHLTFPPSKELEHKEIYVLLGEWVGAVFAIQ